MQKALAHLHFQVSYYDSLQLNKEIYSDTLPVRLVFNPIDKIKLETTISIKVTGTNTFDLSHVDTVTSLHFNEPVDEYYGRFSVVHSSNESYKKVVYLLKLHDPEALVKQYYNALDVKANGDRVLSLSVSSGSAEKSVVFLEELIKLYKAEDHKPGEEIIGAATQAKEKKMEQLVAQTAVIKGHINELTAINTASKTENIKPANQKQFKIYQVIRSYVEAPVRQFTQVPYTDEIENPELRNLLDQYNELQLKKQHLLANKPKDSAAILQADNDLVTRRSTIIGSIDPDQRKNMITADPKKVADSLKSLKLSLVRVRNDIQILKNKSGINTDASMAQNAGLVILESPKDNIETLVVNPLWVYTLAIIAGLLIPIVWWVIREPRGNILPSNLFSAQKLIERINDLFAIKQID